MSSFDGVNTWFLNLHADFLSRLPPALLVNTSAIELATETVSLLLRIDDYMLGR